MEYIVIYGRLDFFAITDNDYGLETTIITSKQDVIDMASSFITVIPDDLKYYTKSIQDWDGNSVLDFLHQDNDTFYFTATPINLIRRNDLAKFHKFVNAFAEVIAKEKAEAKAHKARVEAEHNRPVIGKKMQVVKGRKVPVGTTGVIVAVHRNGSALLLKDANNWKDRAIQGVWVPCEYLKAI